MKMVTGAEDSVYDAMARMLDAGEVTDFPAVSTLFQGTRKDPTLRGSISGLSTENFTPQHLIHGVMHGMADELFRGELKNDKQFSDTLRDLRDAAGEFTDALVTAQKHEKKGEFGSALALYYRALELNPTSIMAKDGIKRVSDVIFSAKF